MGRRIYIGATMIEKLAARVFATRNAAHIAHWSAKGPGSYARHKALGKFYEGLVESIDSIVEAYQGDRGLIGIIPDVPRVRSDTILEHLTAEAQWIATNRNAIAADQPSIANMVDELHALYLTTIYKLTHLA